jgi:hypothetical protein
MSLTNSNQSLLLLLRVRVERERRRRLAAEPVAQARPVWTPQPGPQAVAAACQADVVGYGGAAGGGKTDLLLGLAGTAHRQSIIFRREFPRLRAIIERSREIFNASRESHLQDSFNEQTHLWRLHDDRMVEFGSLQYEDDKKNYQGRPHDFYGIDEACEFTESQVRFVMGWNRTTIPGQRCRVVLTFNPPMDESGEWVTKFFEPWMAYLAPETFQHPKPAATGELRWYAMLDGKETETDAQPFRHKGELVTPRSRTFIPAKLSDNPVLAVTGYGSQIDAMPEPVRSLLKGNFAAAKVPNPYQVITGAMVRAAQKRWAQAGAEPPQPQTALGVDVARGGDDRTVLAPLYGDWFGPLVKLPGRATPDGASVAAPALMAGSKETRMGVDVIGVGSSAYDALKDAGAKVVPINFGAGSTLTDRSGKLRFRNVRAAAYWKFREALEDKLVALPDDPELAADLCAVRWLPPVGGKIGLEEKAAVKARIGHSPDCADAVVLAWFVAYSPHGADLISF